MVRLLVLALAGLVLQPAPMLHAGAKKPPKITVRFFGEGNPSDGDSFSTAQALVSSGKPVHMQTMPLINEHDIQSFHPFPSPAGDGTFGAYFKLDNHGSNIISQHTVSRKGTHILVWIGTRHVIDLFIDRTVKDGILSVPRGILPEEVAVMSDTFPLMGQESHKKMPKPQRKAEFVTAKPTPTPRTKEP